MTWGKWYWPFFLSLTALLFTGPEIYAIITGGGNTLSAYAWDELDVHGFTHVHTIAWTLSFTAWLLFVITITLHIWWRQFP